MVSGKKHPRTRRSFSSANLVKSTRPDVGIRRAVSQEPPEPPAGTDDGAGRKHGHRARPVTGAAPKRKALSGSKGASAKGHGSVRQSGPKPKPPRSFPRPSSSGGMEGVREAALPQNGNVASSPRPFLASDNGTGTQNARAASPASDGGEVVDSAAPAVDGDEPEAKNGEITGDPERRDAEEIVVRSPEAKLGNGEITSDSETEPSYVFIKKKAVVEEEEAPTRCPPCQAGSPLPAARPPAAPVLSPSRGCSWRTLRCCGKGERTRAPPEGGASRRYRRRAARGEGPTARRRRRLREGRRWGSRRGS
uniref:Uncharacterized protein n=1 Tax=Aegilops tauschii subsp. strangulata TaxID=200361 RepID=A0A453PRX5_AEGTS